MKYIPADKTGFFPANGAKLYYRLNKALQDNGNAPLVVVHGGPGMDHQYLLPLLQLANERDVILYDQIDCGKSEHTNDTANWTLDAFTNELGCLRDALGLDKLHIFASSWGSSIAVNYAARKPEGLLSLTLSGALIDTKRWIADNTSYRRALPQATQAILDKYEARREYDNPEYLDAVMAFYKKHLCRQEPWPDCLENTMNGANGELYNYMWGPTEFLCTGTLQTLDLRAQLAEITAPTLFINGEFDEGTPTSAADFAKLTPNARTWVSKGSSHCPQIEDTENFIATLAGALREWD